MKLLVVLAENMVEANQYVRGKGLSPRNPSTQKTHVICVTTMERARLALQGIHSPDLHIELVDLGEGEPGVRKEVQLRLQCLTPSTEPNLKGKP